MPHPHPTVSITQAVRPADLNLMHFGTHLFNAVKAQLTRPVMTALVTVCRGGTVACTAVIPATDGGLRLRDVQPLHRQLRSQDQRVIVPRADPHLVHPRARA